MDISILARQSSAYAMPFVCVRYSVCIVSMPTFHKVIPIKKTHRHFLFWHAIGITSICGSAGPKVNVWYRQASVVRASTFSNGIFFETTGSIVSKPTVYRITQALGADNTDFLFCPNHFITLVAMAIQFPLTYDGKKTKCIFCYVNIDFLPNFYKNVHRVIFRSQIEFI